MIPASKSSEKFKKLFPYFIGIAILHMVEQLVFSIDELYRIKRILEIYHSWFSNPDQGTVLLVTIGGTVFLTISYLILLGGRYLLIAMAIFGLIGISEGHHLITAVIDGGYNGGMVTAVPFMVMGFLLLRNAIKGWRTPTEYS